MRTKVSVPRAHTAFVIAGDRLTVYQDGRFASEWKIALADRPGQIDFLRPLMGSDCRIKGLYEFEGDTLRFWSGPKDRPADRDTSAPGVIHGVRGKTR